MLFSSACGSSEPAKPAEPAPFDPEQTCRALLDSGAFSEELEPLENEIAYLLFGFDSWSDSEAVIDGSAVYYSTGATSEICAVLTVGPEYDGGMMAAAEGDLKEWVASQIEAERSYRPAEAAKLEKAILEQRENTLLLIVAADAAKAQAAIPAK